MTVSTSIHRARLAQRVEAISKQALYNVKGSDTWLGLYLLRMNVVALERNNDLQVLTDDEVTGMDSFLSKNLRA